MLFGIAPSPSPCSMAAPPFRPEQGNSAAIANAAAIASAAGNAQTLAQAVTQAVAQGANASAVAQVGAVLPRHAVLCFGAASRTTVNGYR